MVNRHQSEPILATVLVQNTQVQRNVPVFEIKGASPEVENSFSEPENVKIAQKDFGQAGEKFDCTFPTHSVTLLKLGLIR